MSGRRFRNLLLLAAVAGLAVWLYRTPLTFSQMIDRLTSPVFQSKAAVRESEHKRVEAEAAPVIGGNQDVTLAALHERMTKAEVRDVLGDPDRIEEIQLSRKRTVTRWTYRRAGRVLDFEEGRVVSIAIR